MAVCKMPRLALALGVSVLLVAACGDDGELTAGTGLSFDTPSGYEFLYGEGNVSADFFVFGPRGGGGTIAIGRVLCWEIPTDAEPVDLGGREVWIARYSRETRLTEMVASGVYVEVVGKGDVDEAMLLSVMAEVEYDRDQDRGSTEACG